jgi:hypothetical protein
VDVEKRISPTRVGQVALDALRHICAIRAALDLSEPAQVIEEVLLLYNADPSIMEWLNWDEIYTGLRTAARQQGLKSCVLHLLMGQPYVRRRFPVVAFAEGDGAFESALRTTVNNIPDKSLEGLSAEVQKLKGNIQRRTVGAILHPDTAAMLAVLLQYDPMWTKELRYARSLMYDVRASALRADLAASLARHYLLDEKRSKSIVEEEQAGLRVAYLQGRQLDGLVYVDWQSIGTHLDAEFTGQINLVRRMLLEPAFFAGAFGGACPPVVVNVRAGVPARKPVRRCGMGPRPANRGELARPGARPRSAW